MNPVNQLIRDVCCACTPLRIIQYAEKRTLSTNKLKALSLCVVIPDGDAREVRRRLHLAISADLPITLSVYNAQQWQSLLRDESSFAAWISRKGQVVYEQEA